VSKIGNVEYVVGDRDKLCPFRGVTPLERAAVNRFLRDLRAALQQHWRAERRTGVVSPFDFPEF
jgi:hypothetical protein